MLEVSWERLLTFALCYIFDFDDKQEWVGVFLKTMLFLVRL